MPEPALQTYTPQGGWLAITLFIVLFCYFWIGLDPLPDPRAVSALVAYGDSSNVFNQMVMLTMAVMVMLLVALHPGRELVFSAYGPLILILAWLALTMLFIDAPDSALRRVIYSALVCLCASAVLTLPRDNAQFARMAGLCLLLAVGLSYFGVVFMPERAIHQATDAIEKALAGDWRGHFGHKNTAAAAMVFAVFFGLYLLRAKQVWTGALLTLMAGVFLIYSGGKTAAALLPVVLVLVWLFERIGIFRLLLVVGGLALVNLVTLSVAVSPPLQAILTGLGIDATFTDRTAIWELTLAAIANRPFTGYGFQSFWQTDALFYGGQSASTWAVTAANAHNGYLDQLINGGWPLLLLVVAWLVILPCIHGSIALARNNEPDLTRLYLRIWMFGLFANCFESTFFANGGPLWFTMLISVFGLRLQAHAKLVENAAIAEPGPRPTPV